jgi:conjugative transfer region protein TrbK
MRGRVQIPAVARTVGYAAVAAAIVAAALHIRHDGASIAVLPAMQAADADSLARELAHCREIGMAADDDPACIEAWAENRRRFFTYGRPGSAPVERNP